jgi:hypothetical protein
VLKVLKVLETDVNRAAFVAKACCCWSASRPAAKR